MNIHIDDSQTKWKKSGYYRKKYADNYPTFLFTTGYDVSVRKNVITLKKEDEKFAEFDVNLNTGKIYYPKVYMDQVGLDFAQKDDTTIYKMSFQVQVSLKVHGQCWILSKTI